MTAQRSTLTAYSLQLIAISAIAACGGSTAPNHAAGILLTVTTLQTTVTGAVYPSPTGDTLHFSLQSDARMSGQSQCVSWPVGATIPDSAVITATSTGQGYGPTMTHGTADLKTFLAWEMDFSPVPGGTSLVAAPSIC